MTDFYVTSAEDIVNLALDRIGYPEPIGQIYEGTKAARIAARVYDQTRDDVLRSQSWTFSRRDVVLSLLKTAPPGGYGYGVVWTSQYPPPPWRYEYAYPDDAIKIRALRPTPILIPSFDPQPVLFIDTNDPSISPSARVILTDLPNALASYTAQITDMATWTSDFIEAMVEALARRFAEALNPEANPLRSREEMEIAAEQLGGGRRG